MDLIRASALQGFPELVDELGGDSSAALRRLRLDPALIGDSEAFLPFPSVVRAIETAAAELACPDFGLRLSERQGVEILGPVALIARHSTTVGEALRGFARYLAVYSPALRIDFDELDARTVRFRFTILASSPVRRAQTNELALGVTVRVLRMLIGDQFRPVAVSLPHTAISTAARYIEFFGCRPTANQDFCGFDFHASELTRHLADDAQLAVLVQHYLDAAPTDPAGLLLTQVRHLVTRSLPTGGTGIEPIAAHLGLHPRTLQRRLGGHRTTFEQLVDEVRRERAERYLLESDLPLGHIAALLGYSEQSCLSRSCRRWFGESPRAVRTRGQDRPAVV